MNIRPGSFVQVATREPSDRLYIMVRAVGRANINGVLYDPATETKQNVFFPVTALRYIGGEEGISIAIVMDTDVIPM